VNVTKSMVIREFLFISGYEECIDVDVYWSDTQPAKDEVNIGSLDGNKWSLMCNSTVMGQGDTDHTVLPAEDCAAVPVTEGDTVWFYFGIEPSSNCTAGPEGATLTYELMPTGNFVYDFCPANNTATIDSILGGGGSFADASPATAIPTSAPTTTAIPTSAPTISKAPVTDSPTRHPITSKPTLAERFHISVPPTPGGYVDPAGDVAVDPNSTITFSFFPEICLEVDLVATGILYGHFDADYMAGFDTTEFPITNTTPAGERWVDWGPGTGNTGSFSYPTGTDAHDHEYDEDSASMEGLEFIMLENIKATVSDEAQAEQIKNDLVWKVVAINGDINTAAFITVNDHFNHYDPSTYTDVVTWDDKDVDELPMFTWGNPQDPAWNPAMTDPDLRAQVVHVDEIAMGYKYDAIRRGKGGILPTNTGDMKGNVPGQYGEWRNGAYTLQFVQVDPSNGNFTCRMQPEWSNASVPLKPGDEGYDPEGDPCNQKKRSPQGPVIDCPPGYSVLYEGTLFWHWSGGCEGGSSSYHGADWEADYHSYFTADCRGEDDAGNACVFHELCYVLLDNKEACLNDANQLTLSDIQEDHTIEALFIAKIDEFGAEQTCPEVPVTAAPTVSSVPTISFSPSASPSVSAAPTINAFRRAVMEELDDTDPATMYDGRCWRYAYSWACYPDAGMECQYLDGASAADVAQTAITGEAVSDDDCCGAYAALEDAAPDCLEIKVLGTSDPDQCFNDLTAEGKPSTNQTLTMPDGESYEDGFAVNITVSESHLCSSCWLSATQVNMIDHSKGDTTPGKEFCPGENGQKPWTDYSGWSSKVTGAKKLSKHWAYVFKGDKTKLPYSFSANIWCGQLDPNNNNKNSQDCAPIPDDEVNVKGRSYFENA